MTKFIIYTQVKEWYGCDNDMGKKGLSVIIDGKKMKVKTVKALLKIINS